MCGRCSEFPSPHPPHQGPKAHGPRCPAAPRGPGGKGAKQPARAEHTGLARKVGNSTLARQPSSREACLSIASGGNGPERSGPVPAHRTGPHLRGAGDRERGLDSLGPYASLPHRPSQFVWFRPGVLSRSAPGPLPPSQPSRLPLPVKPCFPKEPPVAFGLKPFLSPNTSHCISLLYFPFPRFISITHIHLHICQFCCFVSTKMQAPY